MNKEKYNQIIDEAYENYSKEYEKDNSVGLTLLVRRLDGKTMHRKPNIEMFVAMCTHDKTFSEKWGLKIEERELRYEERLKLVNYNKEKFSSIDEWISWYNNEPNEFFYMGINYTKETALTDLGVPTKLITITYNNERIESYE